MKYKLIASDLDGTLITNNHNISQENKDAIQRAQKAGITVVLATGRSPASVVVASEDLGITSDYGIGFNGGSVFKISTGEKIYETILKADLAKEIVNEMMSINPNIAMGVYVSDDHLLGQNKIPFASSYATGKIKYETVDFMPDHITKDIMKIVIFGERDMLDTVYQGMVNTIKERYVMVYSGTKMLEFIPNNANKGIGLKVLADHLNIPMEETVAIGDNNNDIEMIQAAGLGVSVANGVAQLKAAANFITTKDYNNSALEELINHIFEEESR